MRMKTFTRLLGSSLIVTGTMVGCSGAGLENRPAIATNQAASIGTDIEKALGARDFARALLDAERLVAAAPRDASARSLLGRAYLANGRYASARTAFEDAVALGSRDPRTIVSLALVHTALGNDSGARDLLAAHIGDLPASDYGLAMTVAGNSNEGVRALLEAVRLPDADARTRQNLAYALALNGNWGQARLVAAQDVTGRALDQRIAQWSSVVQADNVRARVIAMTGVAPRADDEGLPQRLALGADTGPETRPDTGLQPLADAAAEQAAPQPLAQDSFQDDRRTAIDFKNGHSENVLASAADAAPLIRAATTPMREAVPSRPAQPSTSAKVKIHEPSPAPVRLKPVALPPSDSAPADAAPAPAAIIDSDWVVQIGAFGDASATRRAWRNALDKGFSSYRKVESRFAHNGKTWHRLALGGFAGRSAALSFCAGLKAKGQACFVRQDVGLASDIRMARAAKATTKLASR